MPYKLPGQGGLGSPADLRSIQQARQALRRFPKGDKRGVDAVRVCLACVGQRSRGLTSQAISPAHGKRLVSCCCFCFLDIAACASPVHWLSRAVSSGSCRVRCWPSLLKNRSLTAADQCLRLTASAAGCAVC